jgi:hypothetical protein
MIERYGLNLTVALLVLFAPGKYSLPGAVQEVVRIVTWLFARALRRSVFYAIYLQANSMLFSGAWT